jgi:hypothetical protein
MMSVPKFDPSIGADFSNVQVFDPSGARSAAQMWSNVARTAEDVVQRTNRALDTMAQERGEQAGKIAGAEPGFDPASVNEATTIFDKSFRDGALSSYVANLDVETNKALGDIAARELNPAALGEQMDAYIKGVVEGLPEDLQPSIGTQLKRSASGYYVNATRRYEEEQRTLNQKNTAAAFELATDAAIKIGVPKTDADRQLQAQNIAKANAYLDSLVAQRAIAPAEAEQKRVGLQKELYQATVLSGLDESGDKLGYIKAIADGDGGPLQPQEKDRLVDRLRAAYNDDLALTRAAEAQRQEEIKAQYAQTISDLDIKISRGQATEQEIEELYSKGAMTADARADRIIKLDKQRADTESVVASMERVSAAVAGETLLNPVDAKDKKAVDEYYRTRVMPAVEALPVEQQRAALTNLVKTTGVLPKTVKGNIIASFRAGSPEQAGAAADLLDELLVNTNISGEFEKRDIALGLEIRDLVRAGVEPTEAVERARKLHDPANTSIRQAREAEVNLMKLGQEYEDWATTAFETILPFDEPASVMAGGTNLALRGDFEAVFRDWYVNTGDKEKARELATRDIAKSWGVTNVDGTKRLMKYAPERYYAFGDDTDWLADDLIDSVRSLPGFENVETGDVLLGSDIFTQRGAMRGQPDYPILVKNADGVFEVVQGKRYQPSVETKRRKAVEKAQEQREARANLQKMAKEFSLKPVGPSMVDLYEAQRIKDKDLLDKIEGFEKKAREQGLKSMPAEMLDELKALKKKSSEKELSFEPVGLSMIDLYETKSRKEKGK